ncbi:MAG: hypothetical protein VB858_06625, partial [Planctomycetaceae bacterium]
SRTALWFSDGSPALIEKQTGSGRVVLAATSADNRWGTWAIWAPSFVPMMHELVLFSASGRSRNRQLTVGEPIVIALPPRLFDLDVQVKRPDGSESVVPLNDGGHTLSAIYEATTRTGIYQVRFGAPLDRTEICTVNFSERESDLTASQQPDLSSELFADINVALRTSEEPATTLFRPGADSTLSALSRILAWTVLCTLLLEPLLAWRFAWGIAAFSTTAIVAILAPVLGWELTAAVGIAGFAAVTWWVRTGPGGRRRSVADG